jgi:DNA polymerase-3 subunit delta'
MNIYPWQNELWKQLQGLTGRYPHALLFHGQEGIGKSVFARFLAKSLLCEARIADGHACGLCSSCLWVSQGSHPDFRMVRSESIDAAEGLEREESGDADDEGGAVEAGPKKSKTPSKEIKIEQVRALASFLNLKTHRGGLRVVLIYPAHAMNTYTANALLKMLEEPPPDTVFLLVTDALERLLPTIRSRCRKFAMATPETAVALAWLQSRNVGHAERLLAEQGGAPLAALHASVEGADLDAARERFLRLLADPDRLNPVQAAETVAKIDLPLVVGWLQRWVFDCLGHRLAGRVRYYPSHSARIAVLSATLQVPEFFSFVKLLSAERRVAEHPLNARLFVESLLMAYVDALEPARD